MQSVFKPSRIGAILEVDAQGLSLQPEQDLVHLSGQKDTCREEKLSRLPVFSC